jgi:hypothetical protein
MATLELFFIHNLNIPYYTSSLQQSSKWCNELEPINSKSLSSQYQAFSTSKYLIKLSSQLDIQCLWHRTRHNGGSNCPTFINWVVIVANQQRQSKKEYL